jgi:hypothetical protein
VTPCILVGGYQHFWGTYYLHLQGWWKRYVSRNVEQPTRKHAVTTREVLNRYIHCRENLKSHIHIICSWFFAVAPDKRRSSTLKSATTHSFQIICISPKVSVEWDRTPVSYSGNSGSQSWLGDRLSVVRVFIVLLNSTRQMLAKQVKMNDYRVLQYPFQLIRNHLTTRPTMSCEVQIPSSNNPKITLNHDSATSQTPV